MTDAEVTDHDKAASVVFWEHYGTPLLRALLKATSESRRTSEQVPDRKGKRG